MGLGAGHFYNMGENGDNLLISSMKLTLICSQPWVGFIEPAMVYLIGKNCAMPVSSIMDFVKQRFSGPHIELPFLQHFC
jgi:hypothetical protein